MMFKKAVFLIAIGLMLHVVLFCAYAHTPNQAFHLKMNDTTWKEDGVILLLEPANEWTEIAQSS